MSIDSLNTLASVAVDTTGDGSYGTTWTNGTHFYLGPVNASADGYPYKRMVLRSQNGARFPGYDNCVKITGSFGWAECPAPVAQAAQILAGRFLKRGRETPYGILTVIGDAVTAARLGRIDPDVAFPARQPARIDPPAGGLSWRTSQPSGKRSAPGQQCWSETTGKPPRTLC